MLYVQGRKTDIRKHSNRQG